MNKTVKLILLIAVLAAVIVAASFGYKYLSDKYQPDDAATTDSGNINTVADDTGKSHTDTTARPVTEEKAPDFTVKDMNGNAVSLSGQTGKPVIINFWATWCGPCKSELPAFNELYAEYGDRVTFMMVNLTDGYRDTEASVRSFVNDNGFSFPVYFDSGDAAVAYGIISIPLTVMIDENGVEADRHIGSMSKEAIERYIKGLIGE